MSLTGKYYCSEINATLVIQNSNDSNGQANGSITIDNVTIDINIHYHFENNVGPVTDLNFKGQKDNPNYYVGGSGRTTTPDFSVIRIAGGYPTANDVNTFEGSFHRQ
ncbi:MAG: hypothetical protein MUC81_09400 [Bacteroidia bacterium]|jgi:hypothetical protein|nr:hypothetical protein [Bacteroidia bacterium]